MVHDRIRGGLIPIAGILFALLLTSSPATGGSPFGGIFPPTAHPHGMSYSDWQAYDWQLAYETDPWPQDACFFVESGHVLHSNGSFGGDPVEYTCTIPTARFWLLPLITTCVRSGYECPGNCGAWPCGSCTPEEMTIMVTALIDSTTVMELEIDGVPQPNLLAYRSFSPEFDWGGGPAVADGYYVMVKPLPPGEHVIHVLTQLDLGGPDPLHFETTLNITVAP